MVRGYNAVLAGSDLLRLAPASASSVDPVLELDDHQRWHHRVGAPLYRGAAYGIRSLIAHMADRYLMMKGFADETLNFGVFALTKPGGQRRSSRAKRDSVGRR